MARLKTSLYVSALLQRIFQSGGMAVVQHKGHADAGEIFIIHELNDGTAKLFGPAPQSLYEDSDFARAFIQLTPIPQKQNKIQTRIEKERKFDRDLWVVVMEGGEGRDYPFEILENNI